MTENWSGLLQKVENQNEVENFSPCYITEKKCKLMRWEMNVIHDKKAAQSIRDVTQSIRIVCVEGLRK